MWVGAFTQVEEELMMNANLAKLAVKSTSGDFDVLASDFMREVRLGPASLPRRCFVSPHAGAQALGHSRGALPTHAVMRELIDAKFDALAGVLGCAVVAGDSDGQNV